MEITFHGKPLHTIGGLPALNTKAPNFTLVRPDLSTITLLDLQGQNVLLNIFISLDTPVCATSVRKFNQDAAKLSNTKILCISTDLPFAQQRFCAAEGLSNVIVASAFRNPEFGRDYGVTILDTPLKDLLSRAIVVIDAKQKVIYSEQVKELAHEPNYENALKMIKML